MTENNQFDDNFKSDRSTNDIINSEDEKRPLPFALCFILFMIMGSGANWVLPTALAQEIPYFEVHQPEGLCIATYMNATVNIGLIAMFVYVYIYKNISKIPYNFSVPILLVVSSVGCILTAYTYSITVGKASLLLYLSCAIGGIVGALASVIMSPFLMSYENNFISAARSGGSAMILLTALIALAQSPGDSTPRFSVSVYMIVFAVLLSFPIFAYFIIVKYNIGLRPSENTPVADIELSMSLSYTANEGKKNDKSKAIDDLLVVLNNPLNDNFNNEYKNDDKEESKLANSDSLDFDNVNSLNILYPDSKNFFDKLIDAFVETVIPDSIKKKYPWLPRTMPYMFSVAWVDFNNWGVLTAALPFAVADASTGAGAGNLAIAFEIGALCLVLGDASTTLWKVPFRYSMFFFTVSCLVIYIAAFGVSGFQSSAGAPFLIILYCVTQYFEAHTLTSSYRACAIRFPKEFREDASRAVGISDQIATTLGAVVSTIIISQLGNC